MPQASVSATEVRRGQTITDLVWGPLRFDLAVHHDRRDICHTEDRMGELFNDEDGRTARRDLGHDLVQLLDDQRCEAHGQFVQQQHRRVARQSA